MKTKEEGSPNRDPAPKPQVKSRDRVICALWIDDVPIGALKKDRVPNLIHSITIYENAAFVVPSAEIIVQDRSGSLAFEQALRDGTKIRVQLGVDEQTETIEFRVYSGKSFKGEQGEMYQYNCLLDVPKYYAETVRTAYRDQTTAKALKALAREGGLSYDGLEDTNDEQTWVGVGVTRAKFARDLADHGYLDSKDYLDICVKTDKTFRYVNITEEFRKKVPENRKFYSMIKDRPERDPQALQERKFFAASGFRNVWSNYGYLSYFSDIMGEEFGNEKVEVEVHPKTFLDMNKDISGEVDLSRLAATDYDVGNVYEEYQRAAYQNFRIKSFYSDLGNLLFNHRVYDMGLYDVVKIIMKDDIWPHKSHPKATKWMIHAKTRYIVNGVRYAEKYDIMRALVKNDGLTTLVTGDG